MRILGSVAVALAVNACAARGVPEGHARSGGVARAPAGANSDGAAWTYDVAFDPAGATLEVEARLERATGGALAVAEGAAHFVRDLRIGDASGAFRPAGQDDLAACARRPCRLRYRFLLGEAARAADDRDVALQLGEGAWESPPSTWLLRPDRAEAGTTYALTLRAPPGSAFVAALASRGDAANLDDAPYAAVGAFRLRRAAVPGGTVEVAIAPGEGAMDDDAITAWVADAARPLADLLAPFPVARTLVVVGRRPGRSVNGTTMGGGGASVLVELGAAVDAARARADWVLTHELVHVATPTVGWHHRWMEEGLATYLEPVVRARAGVVRETDFWRELAAGVRLGLPGPGDRGLDGTRRGAGRTGAAPSSGCWRTWATVRRAPARARLTTRSARWRARAAPRSGRRRSSA